MSDSVIRRPPVIALVGRPRVGKSTLFNRLAGRRLAIVPPPASAQPARRRAGKTRQWQAPANGAGAPLPRGTTRDWLSTLVTWRGRSFTFLDTAGKEWDRTPGLAASIQQQLHAAVLEADALILVCNAQEGLLPADERLIAELRKTGKPCLVAVNKVDEGWLAPPEFFSLGGLDVVPVSALHGRGIPELLDRLEPWGGATTAPADTAAERIPSIAIIGRQNVGKSSLLNALLRRERVIVSEQPGTTRDVVDTRLERDGQSVRLLDTAGLRHRRKVTSGVDHAAMSRAREALARCDVALIVLDATQGVTRDDQRLMTQACEAGCGCVLVVNKWDLMTHANVAGLREALLRHAPSMLFAPVVAVSALTGWHVADALKAALGIARRMSRPLSDDACRALLQRVWKAVPPPRYRGRAIQLRSARWLPGRPAQVALALTPTAWLSPTYQRVLLKRLWSHPDWAGIPVRLKLTTP